MTVYIVISLITLDNKSIQYIVRISVKTVNSSNILLHITKCIGSPMCSLSQTDHNTSEFYRFVWFTCGCGLFHITPPKPCQKVVM